MIRNVSRLSSLLMLLSLISQLFGQAPAAKANALDATVNQATVSEHAERPQKEPKPPQQDHVSSHALAKINRYLSEDRAKGVEAAKQLLFEIEDPVVQASAIEVLKTFGSTEDAEVLRELSEQASPGKLQEQAETAYYDLLSSKLTEQDELLQLLLEQSGSKINGVRDVVTDKLLDLAVQDPEDPQILSIASSALDSETDRSRADILFAIANGKANQQTNRFSNGETEQTAETSTRFVSEHVTGETVETTQGTEIVATGVDTYEYNDNVSYATPISLGSSYGSYISTTTDIDYYKIVPTQSGILDISMTMPVGVDYDLDFVNSSYEIVTGSYSAVNTTESMSVTVQANSVYYVRVFGYNGAYSANPYTLTLGSVITDYHEPNDSMSAAITVSQSSTYKAMISRTNDLDYYKLSSGTNSGAVQISLAVPVDKDYNLKVYDAGGVEIVTSQLGVGSTEKVILNISANAVYYIHVYGVNGSNSGAPYTLSIGKITNDTYEPNDAMTSAYHLTPTSSVYSYQSYILTDGDQDYFKVTATTTGTMRIRLAMSYEVDLELKAYTAKGALINSGVRTQKGGTEEFVIPVTENLTYYFHVYGKTGSYGPFGYTLYLFPVQVDTFEWNNKLTAATPITLGNTATSYISQLDDLDYFKFVADKTGTGEVNLTVPSTYDFALKIFDSSGVEIAASNKGKGIAEQIIVPLSSGATYYAYVYPADSYSRGSNPYTLKVTTTIDTYELNDSTSTAYSLVPDQLYTSFISKSADTDFYKFVPEKTGNHHITVKVPATKNYDVIIYNDSMTEVASGKQLTGAQEEISFKATAGKVYYVKVFGVSGAYSETEAYTFMLTQVLVTYVYDESNRLTEMSVKRGMTTYKSEFAYDLNGNLTKKIFTVEEAN